MINRDDITILSDIIPGQIGIVSTQGAGLTVVMDQLQDMGLLGLSPEKRKAALKGLSGEQVKELQTTLVGAGFKDVGSIDGIAGKNTLKGLEQALAKNTLNEIFAEADASDNETVRRIQDSLNTLEQNAGPEDGVIGIKTSAALGRYLNGEGIGAQSLPENIRGKLEEFGIELDSETSVKLPPASMVGSKIDPALAAVLGAYEQNKDDVKLIQSFLKERDYDVGKVDGDFGPRTTRAFVQFLEENPEYHSAMGPNLILETEIYALDNPVSDALRESLKLRDLSKLPEPDDALRYEAYKDYFESEGKPVDLARGIKVASEMTGIPMEKLFVVMKQESINFGDYNPRYGNSSANRIADNYGQFTNNTKGHMDENYGDDARRELGREGIVYNPKEDWRDDPLVAPYMVAKYLQETGSYPAYVLPAMKGKEGSSAIVARHYPDAAASNPHILGGGRSFKEARVEIMRTLDDEIRDEREIVRQAQLKALKDDILKGRDKTDPYMDDSIDPKNRVAGMQTMAGLVGDKSNPESTVTAINFKGSFAKASELVEIADMPNGKGPKPSGWAPPSNDFV